MSMTPFYTKFPDLAFEEMMVFLVKGDRDIPEGEYGLVESYCDEKGCDCRRVIITIMSPPPGSRVWATINYGWESAEFYGKWMGSGGDEDEYLGARRRSSSEPPY